MSDREILQRFEDWLVDEIRVTSNVAYGSGFEREALYIFKNFRKIKEEGMRKEKHEESVESNC